MNFGIFSCKEYSYFFWSTNTMFNILARNTLKNFKLKKIKYKKNLELLVVRKK